MKQSLDQTASMQTAQELQGEARTSTGEWSSALIKHLQCTQNREPSKTRRAPYHNKINHCKWDKSMREGFWSKKVENRKEKEEWKWNS